LKHTSGAGFDTLTLRIMGISNATSLNVGAGGSDSIDSSTSMRP